MAAIAVNLCRSQFLRERNDARNKVVLSVYRLLRGYTRSGARPIVRVPMYRDYLSNRICVFPAEPFRGKKIQKEMNNRGLAVSMITDGGDNCSIVLDATTRKSIPRITIPRFARGSNAGRNIPIKPCFRNKEMREKY